MNLLATQRGRKVLFASLYLSEGAPIGYVWWALPTKLADAGVPVERVTALTAMVAAPWALKFLWAPFIDTLRGPRWGYRAWIVLAQLGMGLSLLPMLWLPIAGGGSVVATLLLVHAVLAATQDAAVDALCISSVPEAERGRMNGWMQAGMLVGRSVFGGAVLYFERWWDEGTTILLMLACIWFSTVLVWMSRDSAGAGGDSPTRMREAAQRFARGLTAMLARRSTWLGLLFAVTAGAAFESAGALVGPMLIDQGVSSESVGLFRAVPVVIGMAVGALVGGRAADRLGRRRSVALFGILVAGAVGVTALLLSAASPPRAGLLVSLAIVYVFIGAFTAASYALLMDLTSPDLGATQFSAYMGATNLCEAWAVYTAGRMVEAQGYATALAAMSAVTLLGLLPLRWMRADSYPSVSGDG